MTTTESLIDALVSDARAVRPLWPPAWRVAGWLALAAGVLLVLTWIHGPRPDLARQLGDPGFVIGLGAAAFTGVLGAIAALTASLPDRSRLWLWLPLPAGLVWVSTITWGCLEHWVSMRPGGMQSDVALSCVVILLASSVPLSAALFWMLRATASLRPTGPVMMAGLAVAGLSATVLNLLHAFNASAMILLWNFGAAAIILAGDAAVGQFILRRSQSAHRSDMR